MNTPTGKAWNNRRTNKKFRRLFKQNFDIGEKLSCGHVHWPRWGGGYRKVDFPKDKFSKDEE